MRFLLLIVAIVVSGQPALASDRAVLRSPSDTVQLRAGGSDLFAYFRLGERGLVVTVLLSGEDGQALRSRVSLADGQRHAIHVGEDDVEAGARVSLSTPKASRRSNITSPSIMVITGLE